MIREAGADATREHQLAALDHAERESPHALLVALERDPSDDGAVLPPVEPQLEPLLRPPGHVEGALALGHEALEARVLRGRKDGREVALHVAREGERRPLPFHELLEQLAPRLDGLAAQVAPVQPEQVEGREAEVRVLRLARDPRLKRVEARPPLLVDCARFAVDDALARREPRDPFGDGTEAIGPVVGSPRVEVHVVARLAREEAIAVVLHLEEPLTGVGECLRRGGEHRLAHQVLQRTRARALLGGAHAPRPARRLPAAHHGLGPLGDHVVRGVRVRVLRLEHEPLRLAAAAGAVVAALAPRLHEVPVADELLAVEAHVKMPLLQHRVLLPGWNRFVGPAIPDEDVPRTVFSVRNSAFEGIVFHGVILGLHREALDGRVVAGPLGYRPAGHRPVDFEPDVVVHPPSVVLLDHENELCPRPRGRFLSRLCRLLRRSPRLGRNLEMTLRLVGRQPFSTGGLARRRLRPSHRSYPCAPSGPAK